MCTLEGTGVTGSQVSTMGSILPAEPTILLSQFPSCYHNSVCSETVTISIVIASFEHTLNTPSLKVMLRKFQVCQAGIMMRSCNFNTGRLRQ